MTLAAGVLDPATHEPLPWSPPGTTRRCCTARATGELADAIVQDVAGVPLGIMEGFPFDSCKITLQPGDSLLLFTDGVHESKSVNDVDFKHEGIQPRLPGHQGAGRRRIWSSSSSPPSSSTPPAATRTTT